MNIIGYDFYVDDSALITSGEYEKGFNRIKLQNGTFDDILVSDSLEHYGAADIPVDWDSNTVLHAQFNGNAIAGNIDYKAEVIDCMRLKRREVGTTQWLTVYEVPISSPDDFQFAFIDRYAKCADYEYCVVPVIGNTEQGYMSEMITSKFDGIVICDTEKSYKTIADNSVASVNRNRPNNVVTTLENKYPYVIYNGQADYETGTVQGLFVEVDWKAKRLKLENITRYSHEVLAFLQNSRPKILKTFDGRIWMIDVTGTPTATPGSAYNQITISFEWTEIGSAESSTDLYNNAFIDVNVERS